MKLLDTNPLPLDHPALVPDFWTSAILAHPRVDPKDRVAVLMDLGLPVDTSSTHELAVTQNHEAALLDRLADRLNHPLFGAEAGTLHDPRRGSILTYISMAADTLSDQLDLLARYMPITRTKARLSIEKTPGLATIVLSNTDPKIQEHRQHTEFAAAAVIKMMQTTIGQNPAVHLRLAHGQESDVDGMAQILGCPVSLGARRLEIQLCPELLQHPVNNADSRLLQHLRAYGDILLKRRRVDGGSIRDAIDTVVLPRLSHGVPTLTSVAQLLGLSARTLSRRLSAEGLSFRQVIEDLRYDLARHYLADPNLPLAEIGFLLGFADQSSFGTAFRRWAGDTPFKYRSAL
ncbi:AraC family transcriptional regulator [Falsiruegeria litorea]|uniref:AraC family transcriptional regulator n=1 Tax=Falsiruegeria litorea TaxID=1280831 RepID=A0ABS5WXH2_9RHOB|nr:AraC family transcriptional regulator [Falsiruegeria litorea]MBT3143827.1 AraC family transcriptional regulator [Falsiruegeria litorea]MBT8169508.1 AraC family transcriptional regulator [Falsiruegeria litorea]